MACCFGYRPGCVTHLPVLRSRDVRRWVVRNRASAAARGAMLPLGPSDAAVSSVVLMMWMWSICRAWRSELETCRELLHKFMLCCHAMVSSSSAAEGCSNTLEPCALICTFSNAAAEHLGSNVLHAQLVDGVVPVPRTLLRRVCIRNMGIVSSMDATDRSVTAQTGCMPLLVQRTV